MDRWIGLDAVPAGYGPSAVTMGNFDGVHRGHRAVLSRMVAEAAPRGLKTVAVTFDPHPKQLLYPDTAPALITGLDQRLDLLEATGLDAVWVMPFTLELAHNSAEDFVRKYFVEALGAAEVVVGRDVRFGWQNKGDLATMVDLGRAYGFTVEVQEDVAAGRGRRWSSTWVRELLGRGEVAEAAEILGRQHALRGTIVHGDARGRELGFPTANLSEPCEGLVPADGVYAGWLVRLDLPGDDPDRRLPAAISVGVNPTFDGRARRVESYVPGRTDLDLYGERVSVEFVARLRGTERFDGIAPLVEQMHRDTERTVSILGVRPGVHPGTPGGQDPAPASRPRRIDRPS